MQDWHVCQGGDFVEPAPSPGLQMQVDDTSRQRCPLCQATSLKLLLQAHAGLLTGLTSLTCAGIRPPMGTGLLNMLLGGLLALEACSLSFGYYPQQIAGSGGQAAAGFPSQLLKLTRLSSLVLRVGHGEPVLDFWGLPDGVSALQRLRVLRLRNCSTQRLTDAITALHSLTQLGLFGDRVGLDGEELLPNALPPAATALTGLQCLDTNDAAPFAVLPSLTGEPRCPEPSLPALAPSRLECASVDV